MTFIFRNKIIFWDISKWNRGQKKWDEGSNKLLDFFGPIWENILNYVLVFGICVSEKNV